MKDNAELEIGAPAASGVEALFEGLRRHLLKEAERTLPVLARPEEATGHFVENSLERMCFVSPGNGIIPRGSVVLMPSDMGE